MRLAAAAVLLAASGTGAQTPVPSRPGAAAGGEIVVERRGEPTVEASAGGLVTVAFLLRNRGEQPARIRTEALLPAGWRRVGGREEEVVAGRDSVVHLLAFRIADDAQPGPYRLVYRAVAADATGAASDSVTVVVGAVRALALTVLEAPRFVAAGSTYEVSYLLRNRGNVPVRVELDVVRGSRFAGRLDSTSLTLGPGESSPVRVSVETDPRLHNTVRNALTLRARVAEPRVVAGRDDLPAGEPVAPAVATSVVEVIATGVSANGRAGTFPMQLAVRGSQPWGGVPALELSARGPLTPAGDLVLDLLLRGPRPEGATLFGELDEYRAELKGHNFALGLGDRVYSVGQLIQPYWYGFGAGGTVALGAFDLGGFAASKRRLSDRSTRRSGYAGLRLGASRLRFLYDEQTGVNGGRTLGGQGVFVPLPRVSVAVEYGAGLRDAAAGERPDAYAAEVYASVWRAALRAQRLRIDPDYPGDYRGVSLNHASLGIEPLRGLHATAWLSRSERMVGANEFGTQVLALDMGYRGLATFTLRSEERRGGSPLPYERRSRSARLRLGAEVWGVRLNPDVELGSTEDLRTGATSPLRRYQLRVTRGSEALWLSGWVDRLDGQTAYLAVPQAWVSVGAQTRLRFGQATWLRASVLTRRFDDARLKGTTVAELAIEHRLPFGHSIASRARSVGTGLGWGNDRVDAIFEYIAPFAVPLPGGARGEVIGRVYDAQTGAGIGGVPVRVNGRTALSDARGEVRFRGLAPGKYHVTLDRIAAGVDRVPLVALPLQLEVSDGDPARFEIGLVRGGRVSGVVRRYAYGEVVRLGEEPELVEAGGLANVVVQASSGTEVQRRLTDENGRFDFGLLPPGPWKIEIQAADLPRYSRVEGTPEFIELAAGDTQTVAFRVVPVRREVRIVSRGEITVSPGPAREGGVARGGVRYREVQPGDRGLMDVARKEYGDPSLWPKIWVANRERVLDPDTIQAGQRLVIPPPGPLTAEERAALEEYRARVRPQDAAGPTGAASGVRYHEVQPGDRGLMDVARREYGDPSLWPKIWVANRAQVPDPDRIRVGQRLVIPPAGPLTAEEREAIEHYRQRRGRSVSSSSTR